MKKIIVLILCLFSLEFVDASVEYKELPYYVQIGNNKIQVKKVTDGDVALFNVEHSKYGELENYEVFDEINSKNYGGFYNNLNYFHTIVDVGYRNKESDYNYFLTQVMLWRLIGGFHVRILDENGVTCTLYDEDLNNLKSLISNRRNAPDFVYGFYNTEIWDTTNFYYEENDVILDTPVIDGLEFNTVDKELSVYNEKIGNYEINLSKIYNQVSKSYNDGTNLYWTSLEGAGNIESFMYYNVYGTKLNIIEKIEGVDNRVGDATTNSKYELYLDDTLRLVIDELSDIYVKSNSSYKLKSISESIGYEKINDITFDVVDEEVNIVVEKSVIKKKIDINVLSDDKYYVYLKSNGELYAVIDKDTDSITLPYGMYYIKDELNYVQDLEVINSEDEVLFIEEDVVEDTEDKNIVDDKLDDEVIEQGNNDNKNELTNINNSVKEEINKDEEEMSNPKTLDNIHTYIGMFVISIVILSIVLVIKVGGWKNQRFL